MGVDWGVGWLLLKCMGLNHYQSYGPQRGCRGKARVSASFWGIEERRLNWKRMANKVEADIHIHLGCQAVKTQSGTGPTTA